MKKLLVITVLILCAVFLVSCSEYDRDYVYDGSSLVGVWQERDFDEKFYKIYEFKADGTVTQICYTNGIVNDISLSGNVQNYSVEDSNTLVLTYENSANGKKTETRLKFSINGDRELVLHQDGDDLNVLVPYSLSYDRPDKSPVIGKWINEAKKENGEIQRDLYWFLETGECIIFANVSGEIGDNVDEFSEEYIESEVGFIQSMLFATSNGNKINLCFAGQNIVSADSVVQVEYEISGNKLFIKSEGEIIAEFVRG